jgi:hypothetical protein
VTGEELAGTISGYRAGLEAELSLLRRLQRLADEQHEAMLRDDIGLLAAIGDEREWVMASLVEVEHQIKPLRQALASALDQAATTHGFDEVIALHRAAGRLVSSIMTADQGTMQALRGAEVTRRLAAQTVEKGTTTLAAYRRVVAPRTRSAIVDAKG